MELIEWAESAAAVESGDPWTPLRLCDFWRFLPCGALTSQTLGCLSSRFILETVPSLYGTCYEQVMNNLPLVANRLSLL